MLSQINPECRAKFAAVVFDLEANGFRPRVQEALRKYDRQVYLLHAGLTKTMKSKHLTGRAVDLIDDDNPNEDNVNGFAFALASAARAHGLTTGLTWGLSPVAIHELVGVVDNWKSYRQSSQRYKIGWDPLHVEVP